jgi:hypothetical protein
VSLFDWFARFRRPRAFPDEPHAPVRVDVIGWVVSPNVAKSPITEFDGAVIDVTLIDRETIPSDRYNDVEPQVRLTPLGRARYGAELTIADDAGRQLVVQRIDSFNVVPLSARPLELDVRVPPELANAAARSRHMLTYREVRFRQDDRVRVVATVTLGLITAQDGYRGGTRQVLVPVEAERFELHEML